MQNTEVAQATSEVLDVLAARFGTTVAHLWDVLLRQAVAEGRVNFAWAVIFTLVVVACVKVFLWARRQERRFDYEPHLVISVLVGVLATLGGCIFATDALLHLMNPEFYALQSVMGAM